MSHYEELYEADAEKAINMKNFKNFVNEGYMNWESIVFDIAKNHLRRKLKNRKLVCFYNEDANQNSIVIEDSLVVNYTVDESGKTAGINFERK